MSDCCTPLYVNVPFLSPTGDIRLKRGTGNPPSCNYYKNYTGSPELGNYDYYTVDINYNSGSGLWTFSGNSTGFNDPSIYVSVETGNPCNPIGEYTGGLFGSIKINSDPFGVFPLYSFEPNFKFDSSSTSAIGKGSGIHLERDVKFKFKFLDNYKSYIKTAKDMAKSVYFDGVSYDILNERGTTVYENYLSGYSTELLITEEDNIRIFGSYQPNFGVRAKTKDAIIGDAGSAEYYVYGNNLYITQLETQDDQGTKSWQVDESGANSVGEAVPSGRVENKITIKARFVDQPKYIKPSHVDLYASENENFEINGSSFLGKRNLSPNSLAASVDINKSLGIQPNKDYWFSLVPSSKIGSGNAVKFGPNRIFERDVPASIVESNELSLSYKGAKINNSFKTGVITGEITGGSGIVDKLFVYKESFGETFGIYDGPNLLFSTLPTNASGEWLYTTFDYSMEFKDPLNPYSNISKNIKLSATGSSMDPLNSGMPLFNLVDYNTGVPVELGINYTESGFCLVSNTGHPYGNFKHQRSSF
jgi:hypothetical protein